MGLRSPGLHYAVYLLLASNPQAFLKTVLSRRRRNEASSRAPACFDLGGLSSFAFRSTACPNMRIERAFTCECSDESGAAAPHDAREPATQIGSPKITAPSQVNSHDRRPRAYPFDVCSNAVASKRIVQSTRPSLERGIAAAPPAMSPDPRFMDARRTG